MSCPSKSIYYYFCLTNTLPISKIMFQKLLTVLSWDWCFVGLSTYLISNNNKITVVSQKAEFSPFSVSYEKWSWQKLPETLQARDTSSVENTGKKEFSAAAESDRCFNPLRLFFFNFRNENVKHTHSNVESIKPKQFFSPTCSETERADEAESAGRPRSCSCSIHTETVVI